MRFLQLLWILVGNAAAASTHGHIRLNTGQQMPMVNLGGTAQSVAPGDHFSNYTAFLGLGGRGIDTAFPNAAMFLWIISR